MKLKHSENKRMFDRMRARRGRIMKRLSQRSTEPDKISGIRSHTTGIAEAGSGLNSGYPLSMIIAIIAVILLLPLGAFCLLMALALVLETAQFIYEFAVDLMQVW